jgi:tRNA (cmo5U34)-methyltransferase
VKALASFYLRDGAWCLDFGTSTGRNLMEVAQAHNLLRDTRYVGYDIEPEIMQQGREKYHAEFSLHEITLLETDFTHDINFPVFDFGMILFTLQFMQNEYRYKFLDNVHRALKQDGAIIVAEKIVPRHNQFQIHHSYYDFKKITFTPAEIMSKEQDLRSIMWPDTEVNNKDLFFSAGFHSELIWANLQFRAWILTKCRIT